MVHHSKTIGSSYRLDPSVLLSYTHFQPSALHDRANWIDERHAFSAPRNELVDVLLTYNQIMGNDKAAIKRIQQLRDQQSLAVVGGQQVGLFGGPLLVIYKAVTIIQSARKAEIELCRPVIPIFWLAGEDHDLLEINHCYAVNRQGETAKIISQQPSEKRYMASHWEIEDWTQAIEQLNEALPETDYTKELHRICLEVTEQSSTHTEQFVRLMVKWFGHHGLVFIDAADEAVRQLEGPMFARMLQEGTQFHEAIQEQTALLEGQGWSIQAVVSEPQPHVFMVTEGQRELLRFDQEDQQMYVDREGKRWSREDLVKLASSHPKRFSNNVFSRPVMQEYLFPVLSTILGEGEISYWMQLAKGFERFGMRMPIIEARPQVTLIEPGIQRLLDKYEWQAEQIISDIQGLREAWLAERDEFGVEQRFAAKILAFKQWYLPMIELAEQVQPDLKRLAAANQDKIVQQIEFLANRTTQAFHQQHDRAFKHFDRLQDALIPFDKPQERVWNSLVICNKYGWRWADRLLDIPLSRQQHNYISMEAWQ